MNHSISIDRAIDVFRKSETLSLSDPDRKLLTMQIKALGRIRDSLSDFGSMGYKITNFEKLISDPWMENQIVFDKTYAAWTDFRDSFAREIGAMTVNERLCYLGLMQDFENSMAHPDSMRAVLSAAFLSPTNIEAIIQRKQKA